MSSTVEEDLRPWRRKRRAASADVRPRCAGADDPSADADPRETHPAGKDFPPESSYCRGVRPVNEAQFRQPGECEPQLIMLLDGPGTEQWRQRNRLGTLSMELSEHSLHILRAGMEFPIAPIQSGEITEPSALTQARASTSCSSVSGRMHAVAKDAKSRKGRRGADAESLTRTSQANSTFLTQL